MKRFFFLSIILLCLVTACSFAMPFNLVSLIIRAAQDAHPTLEPTPTEMALADIQNCDDDTCLNTCLSRINSAIQSNDVEPLTTYANLDSNFNLMVYPVKDGELEDPTILYVPEDFRKYQQDLQTPQTIWTYFNALVPDEQMKWFTSYTIYTDGPGNYGAWVSSDDTNSEWQLAVDILDAQPPIMLTSTLVHELGHVVTLNSDQVVPVEFGTGWTQNDVACKQFSLDTGCATPDSYMYAFYQQFWKDLYADWMKTVAPDDYRSELTPEERVHQFYEKHPEQFDWEYAATNIKEDMAVSFENFILWPRPDDESIPSQKINFFYDYPEMVNLRKEMIKGICTYAK
jgi:hypothetical protein